MAYDYPNEEMCLVYCRDIHSIQIWVVVVDQDGVTQPFISLNSMSDGRIQGWSYTLESSDFSTVELKVVMEFLDTIIHPQVIIGFSTLDWRTMISEFRGL